MTRMMRTRSGLEPAPPVDEDDEAWRRMAWDVVNGWGKGDVPLRELVAQGLKLAYAMGRAGKPPKVPEPEEDKPRQRTIRRTR